MFNSKTVFITIQFQDCDKLFDYPKYLPMPRKGEIVIFNSNYGKVSEVKHMTEGNVSEIKIVCCHP